MQFVINLLLFSVLKGEKGESKRGCLLPAYAWRRGKAEGTHKERGEREDEKVLERTVSSRAIYINKCFFFLAAGTSFFLFFRSPCCVIPSAHALALQDGASDQCVLQFQDDDPTPDGVLPHWRLPARYVRLRA